MPGLSVIIPHHNHAEFVDVAILSALTLSGVDVEVIVIDDHSWMEPVDKPKQDKVFAVLDKWAQHPKVKIVKQSPQRGIAYTRIMGFRMATKEYITNLDADDAFLKNSAEILIKLLLLYGADGIWTNANSYDAKRLNTNYDLAKRGESYQHLISSAEFTTRAVQAWVDRPCSGGGYDWEGHCTAGWVVKKTVFDECGLLTDEEINKMATIKEVARDELVFYSDLMLRNRNIIITNNQTYLYRFKPYLELYPGEKEKVEEMKAEAMVSLGEKP